MDIVVTDLTTFHDDRVCIADIVEATGACIRPEPYMTRQWCLEQGVKPGSILRGEMTPFENLQPPHVEDHHCPASQSAGQKTAAEFQALLAGQACGSVCQGFDRELPQRQNYIPREQPPGRSILTVQARRVQLWVSQFGKLKGHLTDQTGREFAFLPVADLLLREYVLGQDDPQAACQAVNRHFSAQETVFCRVGLGRAHRLEDGRDGFWLQLNGVYSFPVSWQEGVGA